MKEFIIAIDEVENGYIIKSGLAGERNTSMKRYVAKSGRDLVDVVSAAVIEFHGNNA